MISINDLTAETDNENEYQKQQETWKEKQAAIQKWLEDSDKKQWEELTKPAPSEKDYQRLITGGNSIAYFLAGLICGITPPKTITTQGHYQNYIEKDTNPLGLVMAKICRGIELKKIKTEESDLNTTIRHVYVTEAIDWLESEKIPVSEQLKRYIAEHLQRTTPNLDSINVETHWNVIQTIGWIMFRDPSFVARTSNENTNFWTHWEEHNLPSGTRSVEFDNRRPGLTHLTTEAATKSEGSYISYKDACEQLLSRLKMPKFQAKGLRNNIGDYVPMTESDWIDADFHEDRYKIYVSGKNHAAAVGRTKWYEVKFSKQDIMNEWPVNTPEMSDTRENAARFVGDFINNFTKSNSRKRGGRSDERVYNEFLGAHKETHPNIIEIVGSHNSAIFRSAWRQNSNWKGKKGRTPVQA